MRAAPAGASRLGRAPAGCRPATRPGFVVRGPLGSTGVVLPTVFSASPESIDPADGPTVPLPGTASFFALAAPGCPALSVVGCPAARCGPRGRFRPP